MTALQPGAATMTVVFTDLVGSTAMRSALGDDRADALRREHDDVLERLIDEHRGVVVKGTGDGVMAVFHAPSDAISSVTAIQNWFSRRNRRADVLLSLRIGVSIGEVRVESDDVFGTPVVEAARLCAKAADDQILASTYVKALAGSRSPVGYDEVGSLELKGLNEPLLAYEVRWWESGAARPLPFPEVPALTEAYPFVGRNLERFALVEAWSRARSRRGPVVFVGGEPGVGKTRFAVQFARSVHNEGAIILYGRCNEQIASPYEPFVEALRSHVAQLSDAQLADSLGANPGELVRLVPELAGRVIRQPAPEVGPDTEALRLYDAVAGWLAAASKAEAIVLLIDDLQWAAASTLAMLRHVLLTTDPMRVLVLATYRERDVSDGHPLAALMAELRQSARGVEQLRLGGVDEPDLRRLLGGALGDTETDAALVPSLASALHEPTRGNPLHVEHALRYLHETRQLVEDGGVTRLAVAPELAALPPSLPELVTERLARLEEVVASTLRVASVLGQEFDVSVLRSLLGVDEQTLIHATKAAIDAGFLADLPADNALGFSHSVIHDSVLESTAIKWRVAVHRRAADEIERQAGQNQDRHVFELAHHFIEAAADGDATKGIDYALSAARALSDHLAFSDARRWYRTALRLLEASSVRDDVRRLDLLIGQGQTEALAGREAALQTLTRAADLALRLGDSAALLQAALAVRVEPMFTPPPRDDRYLRMLQNAVEVAPANDRSTRARLFALAAFELSYNPPPAQAATRPTFPTDPVAVANQALELARYEPDRRVLLDVLQLRIPSIESPDSAAERLELSRELRALAKHLDEPLAEFRAVHFAILCSLELGDLGSVDALIADGRALLRSLHLPIPSYALADDDAMRALLVGDLAEAERGAEQRRQLALVVGRADRPEHLAFEFSLRLQQGRASEIGVLADRLAVQPAGWLGYTRLCVLVEAGRVDEAGQHYREAAEKDDAALETLDRTRAVAASNLAFLAALFGDAAGAERWYAALEPYADQLPRGATVLHCGAHHLGMLSAVLGRTDEAHSWFERAVRVHTSASAPLLAAETHLEWARFCSAANDVARARELAEAARATAVEYRSSGIEGQARALLNAIGRGERRETRNFTSRPT